MCDRGRGGDSAVRATCSIYAVMAQKKDALRGQGVSITGNDFPLALVGQPPERALMCGRESRFPSPVSAEAAIATHPPPDRRPAIEMGLGLLPIVIGAGSRTRSDGTTLDPFGSLSRGEKEDSACGTPAIFAFGSPTEASDYMYLYPGPVFFNQPESALYFPSTLMDAPLAHRTKQDVRAFLAKAPQGWIFASLSEPAVMHRVRDFLENHFQTANDIDAVAQALHFSVRTLCRRLEGEGTSFRLIKDALRRDIAVQRLTQTSRSVAAIAFELGFEDATAFHRAFKQWTGSTPGTYRRSLNDIQATVDLATESSERNEEGVQLPA